MRRETHAHRLGLGKRYLALPHATCAARRHLTALRKAVARRR